MDVSVRPGKYVVAVSGGVDSMVLLDLLRRQDGLDLIVAHFDHGIRPTSHLDRTLVENYAKESALTFESAEGKLGPRASEEAARIARYDFLRSIKKKHGADAIITAHHQDDALETAVINMMRGTGRKGLASLASSDDIIRPLLNHSKKDILDYALARKLNWREDETNTDIRYTRNFIRLQVLPMLTAEQRETFVGIIRSMHQTNKDIDEYIANILQFVDGDSYRLNKYAFIMLPHVIACEALATWLRSHGIRDFDRNSIERLVIAVKTYKAGQKADVLKGAYLLIGREDISLKKFQER